MTLLLCLFLLFQTPSPEAIEHAQAGAAAVQEGKFDVAVEEFKRVTEIQPKLATGYANLGDAYFRKGDYTDAIPALQHALSLNPELNTTNQILGVALLLQGDSVNAERHLEKAPLPQLLGLAYLQNGKLAKAVSALEIALQKSPDDPDVLYYFGRAASLASKHALPRFSSQPIEPAPLAPDQKMPDLAPTLAKLVRQPDDAMLMEKFGDDAALASRIAFEEVLARHAGSARAHQISAERFAEHNRIPEAEKEYAAAITAQPYAPGVHLDFGKLLYNAGDLPHALFEFQFESRIRPLNSESLYYEGSVLLDQGKAGEALTRLEHADDLNPGNHEILLQLGRAAAAAGNVDRAKEAFQQVLESDPSDKSAKQAHAELDKLNASANKKAP